jgi:hypothetical protein
MGPKPLQLIDLKFRPIHFRYRYKRLHRAVLRAIVHPIPHIFIWDLEKGQCVATVTKTRKTIQVDLV